MGGSSASDIGCVDGLACIIFHFRRIVRHASKEDWLRHCGHLMGAEVVESGLVVDGVRCSHGFLRFDMISPGKPEKLHR